MASSFRFMQNAKFNDIDVRSKPPKDSANSLIPFTEILDHMAPRFKFRLFMDFNLAKVAERALRPSSDIFEQSVKFSSSF